MVDPRNHFLRLAIIGGGANIINRFSIMLTDRAKPWPACVFVCFHVYKANAGRNCQALTPKSPAAQLRGGRALGEMLAV
jgi:hypothetical protein